MEEPRELIYQEKIYWGFKKCPIWLKKKLIESRDGKCEDCGSKERLEIHRVKRGVEGGLYTVCPRNHPLNNCKVLCHSCHDKYNYSRKCPY